MLPEPSPRRSRHRGRVALGVMLALALHVLQVPLHRVLRPAAVSVGATQWLYLLPAIWVSGRYDDDVAWGVVLGGGLTMLALAVADAISYFLFLRA